MSRFYEIHGTAISRACNDVRPGETFRIIMIEPLPEIGPEMLAVLSDLLFDTIITLRRSCDGHGCFVVEGHKQIDDFNERHRRRLPDIQEQIKDATAPRFGSMPCVTDPEAAGRSSG